VTPVLELVRRSRKNIVSGVSVGQEDYDVWRLSFGETLQPPVAGSVATALAKAEPTVELSEALTPLPAQTFATPIAAKLGATTRPSFAIFEARVARHETAVGGRERNNILGVAKPTAEKLLLTLASDLVGRSSRNDLCVINDRQIDDHPGDDAASEPIR
jgi:hypothetical protein